MRTDVKRSKHNALKHRSHVDLSRQSTKKPCIRAVGRGDRSSKNQVDSDPEKHGAQKQDVSES